MGIALISAAYTYVACAISDVEWIEPWIIVIFFQSRLNTNFQHRHSHFCRNRFGTWLGFRTWLDLNGSSDLNSITGVAKFMKEFFKFQNFFFFKNRAKYKKTLKVAYKFWKKFQKTQRTEFTTLGLKSEIIFLLQI